MLWGLVHLRKIKANHNESRGDGNRKMVKNTKLRWPLYCTQPRMLQTCLQVENAVLNAGKRCQAKEPANDKIGDENKMYLKELIRQRKASRATGNRHAVATTSKLIQKEIRILNKFDKASKVTNKLQDFKDLGRLADVVLL